MSDFGGMAKTAIVGMNFFFSIFFFCCISLACTCVCLLRSRTAEYLSRPRARAEFTIINKSFWTNVARHITHTPECSTPYDVCPNRFWPTELWRKHGLRHTLISENSSRANYLFGYCYLAAWSKWNYFEFRKADPALYIYRTFQSLQDSHVI